MKKVLSRFLFLVVIGIIWETIYSLGVFHELLFPSLKTIFSALITNLTDGGLLLKTINTLSLIFKGLFFGIAVALIMVSLSISNKYFREITDNLIVFLNPIPGMAIFPLCILWFGFGDISMIVILLHSILWGLLINVFAGIDAIPKIYKEIGLNLELSKIRMFKDIYIPACMPYIISGLKASVARAWRTAIAIELIAGVMANNAGLGWLMTYQRNTLDMPGLFSTVIIIMVVGILLEEIVFNALEKATIKKWGMTG